MPWSIEISVAFETLQRSVDGLPCVTVLGSAVNRSMTGLDGASGTLSVTVLGAGGGGGGGGFLQPVPIRVARVIPISINFTLALIISDPILLNTNLSKHHRRFHTWLETQRIRSELN